jgi:hypothetical protein
VRCCEEGSFSLTGVHGTGTQPRKSHRIATFTQTIAFGENPENKRRNQYVTH